MCNSLTCLNCFRMLHLLCFGIKKKNAFECYIFCASEKKRVKGRKCTSCLNCPECYSLYALEKKKCNSISGLDCFECYIVCASDHIMHRLLNCSECYRLCASGKEKKCAIQSVTNNFLRMLQFMCFRPETCMLIRCLNWSNQPMV